MKSRSRLLLSALLLLGFLSPISPVLTPNVEANTCIPDGVGYTVTVSGSSCIITITATGTTSITLPQGLTSIDYVVLGGGGGGGTNRGGGGGSGGMVNRNSQTITDNAITVVVGAGGAGGTYDSNSPNSSTAGSDGSDSSLTFTNSTAITVSAGGGGGGGTHINSPTSDVEDGRNGRSVTSGAGGAGGGASMSYGSATGAHTAGTAGTTNCPVGAYCYASGAGGVRAINSTDRNTGGGGGVAGSGVGGSGSTSKPTGGAGYNDPISNLRVGAGGGGASGISYPNGVCEAFTTAGSGNGGAVSTVVTGGTGQSCPPENPYNGSPTGKGSGGGGAVNSNGGSGSDGLVIVRYYIAAVPVITTHPASVTKTYSQTNTFTVSATIADAGTRSYQWQKSSDGTNWTNVGTNATSYLTPSLQVSDNGTQFRVIVTNTKSGSLTSSTTSNVATLTVTAATLANALTPTVSQYASNPTSELTITFSSVTNASSYTVRLYQSDGTTLIGNPYTNFTSGSRITGLTPSTSYRVSVQAIGDGTNYVSSAESAKAASVTTAAAAVTPVITAQPASVSKESGTTATFSVTATRSDGGTLSYQWQSSTDGSTWSNVGTNAATYTTAALTDQDDQKQVRVVVTNTRNATTSTATSSTVTISLVTYTILFTTLSESNVIQNDGIVRSNVRSARQFTAGAAATIGRFQLKMGSSQNYPTQVKIVFYADSNNTISTKLGELLYDSHSGLNSYYTGSVSIPAAGTYWFEVQPTAAIANHYWDSTTSTGATGSQAGWAQRRTRYASGGDSVTWSYGDATNYAYPLMAMSSVQAAILQAPTIASATISGNQNVGQTLTATAVSTGGGTATSTTYQWSSSSDNVTYSNIQGATSQTYQLTSNELNQYIKVTITRSNAAGNNSATSSATSQIQAALQPPTLSGANISGTTTQGSTLTASVQGAGGDAATTTTYQWSRADSSGGSYSNIAGATSSTYTLTASDVDKYIKVTIAVSNAAGGPNSATSSASGPIAPSAPTIGSASISGNKNVGQTLTASAASIGGGASTTSYQWRSSSDNSTYSDIQGATTQTYLLTSSELNKYIKVVITVTNITGNASATSSATTQIQTALEPPTLSGATISGTTTQGSVLTASVQGAGGGAATTTTYQWSRADSSGGSYANIAGANSSTYTLTANDVDKYIKVTISVSNSSGGPNSATSSASGPIAVSAPTIASASISGTPTVGQTLTATPGNIGGGASTTTYQWLQSNTSGGTYSNISGATSSTYVLTANEVGKYIKVRITVTNATSSASATSSATATAVISNVATPTISAITSNAGTVAGGVSVTISGTNLSTTSSVTFDGALATISSKSNTQVVVVTPSHAAGAVDVVVTNSAGSVTSSNGYTYVNPPNSRTWVATPSANTSTVGNGGNTITVTYTATCTTPQRYGPSMYDIIYNNSGGSWLYNSYMGSGTSSDGGYTWSIQRTYAVSSAGLWRVYGYTRGACFDSYNFTYTTVAYVAVDVSNPTITSLNVVSGPIGGGTTTTVTGTNLSNITGITLGGVAATVWRNNTATAVTFITPANTSGAKNVVITTPAGTVTSNNAFTYIGPVTITYDVNGADSGSPSRATDSYSPNTGGYSLPTVGTMVKNGYTFTGWASANNSNTALTSPYNPQATTTVYAIWTAKNYTTTYNANGATGGTVPAVATNVFGSTFTVAANTGSLVRTNHSLAGWNTKADGTGTSYVLNSGSIVQGAANQILYAEWVPDTYTIDYDVTGSTDPAPASHTNVLANGTVTLRNGVTKTNFEFAGWETGGVTYKAGAAFTIGAANTSMVAKWIPVYKLSYNLNGAGATGSVPADFQYADGNEVTVTNVVPERPGYTFADWIDQSGTARIRNTKYNISANNYLLYAVWNPINYTVTYLLNGGSGDAPTEAAKNINQTFAVAAAPSRTGYTFAGWKDSLDIVYGAGSTYRVATSNVTLTAQWSANSYQINYDLAQGSSAVPAPETRAFAVTWALPDTPTRVGFNFSDWFDGTNGYAANSNYTLNQANNVTLTARWSPITYYQVTYDLAGGLGDAPRQDPLQNGESFTLPANPEKTGFSFTGWSFSGNTYSSGTTLQMPGQNVTITAQWTESAAGTYAITYISNGSQTPAPTVPSLAQNATFTVDDGSGLIKSGYIFGGWTQGNTIYYGGETFTMPANAVSFSAIWVPSVRATSVSHSVDSNSIRRGQSITVTYLVGCYNFSNTTPTLAESVTSTAESFVGNIPGNLIVIDAGYSWTVTRVYTLSRVGTYSVFATANGGCFTNPTDSTATTVTVTEPPAQNTGTSNANASVPPVTVVGSRTALVANRFYNLPKLDPNTVLSVEARAGASATSTTTTTTSTGSRVSVTTMLSVNSAARGLKEVKIVENQIAVVPQQGFSGRTNVTVTVTDGTSTTQIEVPVTVLPEPVKDPTITPQSSRRSIVSWEASPNAQNYQVYVDGRLTCSSTATSCTLPKILGPNAEVEVVANGGDATRSDLTSAGYEAPQAVAITRIVGLSTKSTLTDSEKLRLDRLVDLIKTQGFETVEISNISTTRRNAAAAKARLDAIINYIQSKVDDTDLNINVVDPTSRTLSNKISVR